MAYSIDSTKAQLIECGYPADLVEIIALYLTRRFLPGESCALVCPFAGFWCSGVVKEVDEANDVVRISIVDREEWPSWDLGEAYVNSCLVRSADELDGLNSYE